MWHPVVQHTKCISHAFLVTRAHTHNTFTMLARPVYDFKKHCNSKKIANIWHVNQR
jgi:hypothetical protein